MSQSPSLEAPLRAACSRVNRLRAAKGLLLWAALVLGTLFLMLGADILAEPESRAARWAMSASLALLWAAALIASLAGVVRARPSPARMARHLEERHPDWQECVSTALELESDPAVSRELRDYLRDQAADAARTVRPVAAFPRAALRPALRLAAAAALLPALLFALWPRHALTALHRLAMPWNDPGNAFAALLTVRPGDAVVPDGATLTLTALSSEPASAGATLLCEYAGGRVTRERMAGNAEPADAAGRQGFTLELRHLKENFRYRVEAGRARSRFYTVAVEALPALEELTATVEPPAYTGRAHFTNRWDDAVLSVPQGSRIRLAARMNKPVAHAEARAPGGPSPPATEGHAWAFAAVMEHTGEWNFAFTDRHGFASLPDARRMQVVPDAAPRVTLVEPRITELELKADAVLPIEAAVEEDIGLMEIGLEVRTEGVPHRERGAPDPHRSEPWPTPEGAPESGLFRVRGALRLADLGAVPGQTLRVRLRAADTRPPELKGPQEAFSKELVIRVMGEAKSPDRQEAEELNAKMQQALEQIRKSVEEARQKAERATSGQPSEKPRPEDNPRDDLARAREAMREAAREPLAGFHPRAAEKMRDLSAAAREAEEKSGQVQEEPQREERARLARELRALLNQMAREVEAAQRLFEQDRKEIAERVAMRELADRQERHSEKVLEKAMEKPGEEPPREWRDEQQRIAQEVAGMASRDPETKEELARQAAEKARELAEKARALAEAQKRLAEAAQQASEGRETGAREAMEKALASQEKELEGDREQESASADKPPGDPAPAQGSSDKQEKVARKETPGEQPSTPRQATPESARAQEREARAQERQQALSAAKESLGTDLPRAATLAQEELAREVRDLERESRATVAQARPLGLPNDPAGAMERQARQALDKAVEAKRAGERWDEKATRNRSASPQASSPQAASQKAAEEQQAAAKTAENQREAANRLQEMANAAEQLANKAQERAQELSGAAQEAAAKRQAEKAGTPNNPSQQQARADSPAGAPRQAQPAGDNAGGTTPGQPEQERAQALARALESASRAAAAATPPGAREAAKEAAAALREAARGNPPPQVASAPAPGRGASDKPAEGPGDASLPPDRNAPPGGGVLADRFTALFIPVGRDWADIRGGLSRGLTGDAAARVPEDYSDLVRDYYESLRREAAKEDP